jgi:hypothetical protein
MKRARMCGKFTALASWSEVVAFSQPLTESGGGEGPGGDDGSNDVGFSPRSAIEMLWATTHIGHRWASGTSGAHHEDFRIILINAASFARQHWLWRAPQSGDTRGTQAKRFRPDHGRQRQVARHQEKRFGQLERDHGCAQHAQRIRHAEPGISAYWHQERHQEACRSDHGHWVLGSRWERRLLAE